LDRGDRVGFDAYFLFKKGFLLKLVEKSLFMKALVGVDWLRYRYLRGRDSHSLQRLWI
jgi:hypothetical protein